mgnify:CR=1 FL=1
MPHRNPLNRTLVQGIQDLGFRRWYERELLSSHAHMTLAILAAVETVNPAIPVPCAGGVDGRYTPRPSTGLSCAAVYLSSRPYCLLTT